MASEDKAARLARDWPEASRRMRIMRTYLDIESPSDEDRDSAIEALGLSYHSFMRLVRILRKGIAQRSGNAKRPSRLDPRVDKAIDDAINDAGPEASVLSIAQRVDERLKTTGLPSPAYKTVERRVRGSLAQNGTEREIVILDAVLLDTAATVDGALAVPLAIAAIRPSPPAVVGLRVVPKNPVLDDLVSVLRQGMQNANLRPALVVGRFAENDPAWTELVQVLTQTGVAVENEMPRARSRRSASQILGDTIAGVPTRPRLSREAILARHPQKGGSMSELDSFMRATAELGPDLTGDPSAFAADFASPVPPADVDEHGPHTIPDAVDVPDAHRNEAADPEPFEVVQADRERAVEIREARRPLGPSSRNAILCGERDHDPLIRGLARHRAAAQRG